jgi:hypothetical protein
MQRVAGVDANSFTSIMMIGIPVLTGLALGAGAFRSRRDPLVVYLMMLAAAALFLTEPYVGYLDDATVLLLLSMSLAFVGASRSSWGARAALFLIGLAAAFVHPTTCGLFGITLLAVFAFHFVTSRFKVGEALRSDGPFDPAPRDLGHFSGTPLPKLPAFNEKDIKDKFIDTMDHPVLRKLRGEV